MPEAEAMIFHSRMTGDMKLRVIDLPQLPNGHHYEVWSSDSGNSRMIGKIMPPVRYDTLYTLEPMLNFTSVQINAVNPESAQAEPICLANVTK